MNGSHENLTWTSKAAAAHSGAACAPYPRTPTPHPLRSAISLLEVLISIGIVAVGLLSIASLLPVGSILVQRANIEQRKTALGMNILRDFTTRGMGIIDPTDTTDERTAWVRADGTDYFPAGGLAPNDTYYPPVAIDSRMVAAGFEANNTAVAIPAIDTFPANANPTGTIPYMRRLTLHQVCVDNPSPPPPHNRPSVLADAIFVPRDDAVVDQPADNSLPATNYPADVTPANEPLSRAYAGEYSWLATIAPGDAATAMAAPAPGQTYTLSVAVFNRRLMTVPSAGSGQEEMVRATVASGYGGGEVQLELTDTQQANLSSYATHPLDVVVPGQWLMLARWERIPNSPLPLDSPPLTNDYWRAFKWYRVVSVAPIESQSGTINNNNDARYVTVVGSDWVPDPDPVGNPQTYACLFAGAVAVYERPVRLEEPNSVWNPVQ